MEPGQRGLRQAAEAPQRDVQGARGMSLGEDEAVFGAHILVQDHHQRVEAGQVAAEMTHATLEVHLQQAFARGRQGLC